MPISQLIIIDKLDDSDRYDAVIMLSPIEKPLETKVKNHPPSTGMIPGYSTPPTL